MPVRGRAVRPAARGRRPGDVPAGSPPRRAGPLRRGQRRRRPDHPRPRRGFRLSRAWPRDSCNDNPALRHVFVDGDPGPFESWSALADFDGPIATERSVDPDSPALLLVSGGTTGLPKLIARTHDDYVYNATAAAQECGLTADDVYLVALPAGHNFPLACPGLLGSMTVGATTVFTTDPSPESAFALIDRHKVTVTGAGQCAGQAVDPGLRVGAGAADVAAAGAGGRVTDDRRGGPLHPGRPDAGSAADLRHGRGHAQLHPSRRSRSTSWSTRRAGRCRRTTRCGWSTTPGAEVAPGEEGELLVRGPYTLNGYYRADEANARSFSPDGFYRTGDRVRIFADGPRAGYVEVTGRIKDVIHRGGETVSASDLEEHLFAHPAIYAAAAVALPDEYLGEKICAAVVFSGPPIYARRTQPLPRRARRVRAFAARRARADADAARRPRSARWTRRRSWRSSRRPDTPAVRTPRTSRGLRRNISAD